MDELKDKIPRDGFIFYRSFFDAIEELDKDIQLEIYRAIARYGIYKIEPKTDGENPDLSGVSKVMFTLIRPQLDANWKKFIDGCKGAQSGKKGGRPRGKPNGEIKQNPIGDISETPQGLKEESPNDKDKVNDNNKDNTKENKEVVEAKTVKRFCPPTLQEVQAYIQEKGYSIDAEAFIAFYESKGWMVGKNKMKDWRMAIVTWSKRDNRPAATRRSQTNKNCNDELT